MVKTSDVSRMAAAAAILVATYFLALGAVRLANLWMLIFGAVVVAVVVRAIADPLVARFKIRDSYAVLTAILLVLTLVGAVGALFGQQISLQIHQLTDRLPGAWQLLQVRLQASPAAGAIFEQLHNLGSEAGRALAIAPKVLMGLAGGITTLVLVLVAGVFLSIHPAASREGLLALAPLSARPRLREVLNTCGGALKGWIKAQTISMLLVGTVVGIGLWVIGVPAPLALGLLTGLGQFVPIVGPIASAAPALIVASSAGGEAVLMTLGLYVVVSQLEANLITPLVQKNVASLPVVLGIFGVVGLGTLFGPLGVLFATPLTLVIYTGVTMLYRQDVLHDPAAHAPGEAPLTGRAKPVRRRKDASPPA